MTKQEYNRLVDALNTSLALNVPEKLARQNIAVAIGQALHFTNNAVNGLKLDNFVQACTKKWA